MDVSSIHSKNENNNISMNNDVNFSLMLCMFLIINQPWGCIYGNIIKLRKCRVCRQNNVVLYLLLNKSKSCEWQFCSVVFFLDDKKLSSHMTQISEYINSTNQKLIIIVKWERWMVTLLVIKVTIMTTPLPNSHVYFIHY